MDQRTGAGPRGGAGGLAASAIEREVRLIVGRRAVFALYGKDREPSHLVRRPIVATIEPAPNRLTAARGSTKRTSVASGWLGIVRDALVPPVFWQRQEQLSGLDLLACDVQAMGSRSRRLRVGLVGFSVGVIVAVIGYRWGIVVDDWLDALTHGAWGFWSRWLGDLAGVPFLLGAIGGMIALSGCDRAVTAAWPWFASTRRLARMIRLGLAAMLGTAVVLMAFTAGLVRT